MKFPELAGEVGLREMLGNFTGLPAACEHKAEPSGLSLRTCPHTAQQHMRAYHPAHQGVSPIPAPQPIVSGRATDHHPNTGHLTSVSSTTALRSPFTKSRGRPQYIQDRSTWGLASLCQATSAAETSPPTSFQASSTRCQWSGHLPLQGTCSTLWHRLPWLPGGPSASRPFTNHPPSLESCPGSPGSAPAVPLFPPQHPGHP